MGGGIQAAGRDASLNLGAVLPDPSNCSCRRQPGGRRCRREPPDAWQGARPCREPRIPVATYRLQFNRQFTFADAQEIVPYLHELGISDIYASSYVAAKEGSLHGYDIVDPNRPEQRDRH